MTKPFSSHHPTLRTERVLLRPLVPADADRLSKVAGSRRIADTTISVAHPFSLQQARKDIARFLREWRSGMAVHFAVVISANPKDFIGYIALKDIDHEHRQSELSFWIDDIAKGQGYTTEAAACIIGWAFRELSLNRIYAHHMARNPASGRVLAKVGMKLEGCLRQRIRKWGVFEDVMLWAVLRDEYATTLRTKFTAM